MKVKLGKKIQLAPLIIALLAISLTPSSRVSAQDDGLSLETADILDSEQIDVDGNLNKKSAADRMAEMRKRLEKEHEDMVSKKIEDMRMQEERKLATKLRKAFNGMPIGDQVSTGAAAPAKIEAAAPVPVVAAEEDIEIKVIPFFGVRNNSTDKGDLESKVNAGLSVEAMVSKRFSVGMSLAFTSYDMTDVSQSSNNGSFNYQGFYNTYNPTFGSNYAYNTNYYNQNYYGAFGSQGREVSYKNLSVGLNSKFFIITDRKIRPYIGMGLSYNRANLAYNDANAQSNYQYNGFNVGGEEYQTANLGGEVSLGSEAYFTKNFGINLDVSYARTLTSGFNSQSANTFAYNPDQQRLEDLGRSIQEGNVFTLNAGILIAF